MVLVMVILQIIIIKNNDIQVKTRQKIWSKYKIKFLRFVQFSEKVGWGWGV